MLLFCFVFVNLFYLKSILSDISISIPALFWLLFAWSFCLFVFGYFCFVLFCFLFFSFSQHFSFNIFVSLDLKGVSNRYHVAGLYFKIHSANLCLLLTEINSFTFKVITDKE